MSAELSTNCPHCGREAALAETLFGSTVRCPNCFREFAFESMRFANDRDRPPPRSEARPKNRLPASAAIRSPAPLSTGRAIRPASLGTIGRFELLERVGQGSFGIVFRAHDPVLDREVAVKIPQTAFADDRATRRFLSEAKAAARLRHPGIVAVYEAGRSGDRPYLVTEFVRGQTLAERLKAGRPPAAVAASWMRDLARALDYAHSEGVVHRDVKPANVMLDVHDRPQLMDFGLARHVDAESSLTGEGALLGTPAYMSPEQARGETAVGPKSDVYSLGAVLYEALGGTKPFSGPPHVVVNQVASAEDPPPLRSHDPSLPLDLESICRKAMEKDPARRYDNAAALADDLARWLSGDETLARPLGAAGRASRWARRRPAVASLAGAVIVTAAVGFAAVLMQWRRAEENGRTARNHLAALTTKQKENETLLREVSQQRDAALRARKVAEQSQALAEQRGADLQKALDEAERNLAEATRQRSRADLAGAEAARLTGEVAGEKAEADRRGAEAARLAARRDLDRAQELAGSGEVVSGLLTTAKALAALPPDSADLEWHLRMNLSLLRRFVHEPVRMLEVGRPVRTLDINPTGLLVATGDAVGAVKVWDAKRGTEAMRPLELGGPVRVVRFSPDGKSLFASAGDTAELRSLVETAAPPRALHHPGAVLAAAFDADGRKIATGADDRRARVWNVAAAKLAYPPLEHDGPVLAVALSPDGSLLLTGTGTVTRRVTLWDATTGRQIAVLHDGTADVTAVAFSPDGALAAAGTADGTVGFWRTKDRSPLSSTLKADGPVRSVAFAAPARLLVAAGNGPARLWDIETGKTDGQPLRHEGPVTAIACDRTGEGLITGGDDGVVRLWRYAGAKYAEGPIPHDSPVSHVALDSAGDLLATGDATGKVRLFDVTAGAQLGDPVTLGGAVTSLAFAPDGGSVACGTADGSVRLLSVADGKTLGPRLRHDHPVASIAFSSDGRRLLTVEKDGPARLWDAVSGKPIGKPLAPDGPVRVATFSPDGRRVATGGVRTLRVWSGLDGGPDSEPLTVSGPAVSLAFSGDGKALLVGTESGEITRWDVETGRRHEPAFSHGGPVHTVAFGPDGRLALTAGPDHDVRLWDTETGRPYGPPLAHPDDVTLARFRGDGRFLVTGTKAGDLFVWDALLGRRLGSPLRNPGPAAALASSADDAVLAVATGGQVARVWKVPPPEMVAPESATAWAELVTGASSGAGGPSVLPPKKWKERLGQVDGQKPAGGE